MRSSEIIRCGLMHGFLGQDGMKRKFLLPLCTYAHRGPGEPKNRLICTILVQDNREQGGNVGPNFKCSIIGRSTPMGAKAYQDAENPDCVKQSLFGIPVSIKECIAVKGYSATLGYAQCLDERSTEDSDIVARLKELGLITILLFLLNQIFRSDSLRPHKRACSYSPAKTRSTGPLRTLSTPNGLPEDRVEAATREVDSDDSILLITVESRVSSRAACVRVTRDSSPPHQDVKWSALLQFRWVPTSTPWSNTVAASGRASGCTKETLTSRQFYLWNDEEFRYYLDDGWFKPIPALQRAVSETKEILERAGHTLVPFELSKSGQGYATLCGRSVCRRRKLPAESHQSQFADSKLRTLHSPVPNSRLHQVPSGKAAHSNLPQSQPPPSRPPAGHLTTHRSVCGNRRVSREVCKQNLDALICPAQVTPVVKHHYLASNTSTVSVNVTRVNEVTALSFREETCLRILAEVEKAVKKEQNVI
ncbi:hypothetical protein L596_005335 [Steinernema carpocapsae]|uniref:Amidase domain-containing protein n=1 Tax=Steinernema carpocapsae TaxID=34508 RepID=A0A4U8UYS6_STECR|nr:hypothetical protein L596_005335 [Steinernema carpocapsae]